MKRRKILPREVLLAKLSKLHNDYEDNFQLLQHSVGTSEHNGYLKIERVFNMQEQQIKRDLGGEYAKSLQDPCPIKRHRDCCGCSQYYHQEVFDRKRFGKCTLNVMCSPTDTNASHCNYFVKTFHADEEKRKLNAIKDLKDYFHFY